MFESQCMWIIHLYNDMHWDMIDCLWIPYHLFINYFRYSLNDVFFIFIFRIRHVENWKKTVIIIFYWFITKIVSNRRSIAYSHLWSTFFSSIFIINISKWWILNISFAISKNKLENINRNSNLFVKFFTILPSLVFVFRW